MSDEQDEVIHFLMNPAQHGGAPVDHVETHGAHIFLSGDEALKIKRAVSYDYMDFSTLEIREQMLRRELELNQPAAPEIYRDVIAVTRDENGLSLGGKGKPVEWVLRMWRFPKKAELSQVVARGEMTDRLAEDLGRAVAKYHAQSSPRDADGARLIGEIIEELETAFSGMGPQLGDARVAQFSSRARKAFDRVSPLLTDRSEAGRVRRCHGDLHLRNLVLIDGRPVPFDALEFDETLGTCDILYDLAFLVMDLQHHDLHRAANVVLNAWLFEQGGAEDGSLAALPLFLAIRAGIRAMVDVQTDAAAHHEGQSTKDAQSYMDYAGSALADMPPRLIAVGGLSGTGKTTLARRLAPEVGRFPGPVHLRSDLERKALAGVDPLEHLPDDAYSATSAQAVYDRLLDRAETVLATGQSVILDATFMAPAEREAVGSLADRLDVEFRGIWLEAPQQTLTSRVTDRRDDASDADASVVAKQAKRELGEISWTRLDTTGAFEDLVSRALDILR